MANLVEWIAKEAGDDPIIAIVIGRPRWGDYGSEKIPQYETQVRGKVLSWEQAKPMLDYEFDEGYGALGCNAVNVWTKTKIMFIVQHDGATSLHFIPRRPQNYMPEMPGG